MRRGLTVARSLLSRRPAQIGKRLECDTLFVPGMLDPVPDNASLMPLAGQQYGVARPCQPERLGDCLTALSDREYRPSRHGAGRNRTHDDFIDDRFGCFE